MAYTWVCVSYIHCFSRRHDNASLSIVDLHSHLATDPAPSLQGSADDNSIKGPTLPWLRALDAINTHDEGYKLAIAGCVTTSLILPGSANAIGVSRHQK